MRIHIDTHEVGRRVASRYIVVRARTLPLVRVLQSSPTHLRAANVVHPLHVLWLGGLSAAVDRDVRDIWIIEVCLAWSTVFVLITIRSIPYT